ncbi:MAG: MFS transporter [Gemmatimonadaceae bacterium]|nr:MFS transporter [Gemmatimonadaceae bacterium]
MRDDHPRRWRMLAVIAVAELLGMALWFTGSAVGPTLASAWQLSASQVGWLTTAVQLGFVAGTALTALLNLADVLPSRRLFTMAAIAGALCNLPLAFTDSFAIACASRALAGVCLAGVYPPAMKMASTWFRERRGFAVGTIVGALTIGKATPYLAQAFPGLGVIAITIASSCSALCAALLIWTRYHDGPYDFPARAFAWSRLGEVWRERRWRLALGGYLGHMAELYSFWTWIPAFLLASDAARALATGDNTHPRLAAAIGFAVIAVGGAGCVWGGVVADRIGREKLVTIALAISGSCALAIGFAWAQSFWILAPLALVWGFFVIADSAQFSVLATESVPAHVVGTALTLQVSLGFLLTTITIQAIPPLVSAYGWPSVFRVLAIGPALGILSIRGMRARA